MMEKNTWIVALLGSLFLMSCAIQPPTPNTCSVNCNTGGGTGSTTINLGGGPSSTISTSVANNLAPFAKVTANKYHDVAAPVNVKDGFIVNNADWNQHKYTNWAVRVNQNIDDAWIKLEWPTPVSIESIRLFDAPGGDHQVTTGQIQFEAWDGAQVIPAKSFSNPVDNQFDGGDGTNFLTVEGPGNTLQIRSMKVLIFSHNTKSLHAGFSEIQVLGKNIESALSDYTPGINLAPYSKIKNASSVEGSSSANPLTGQYGSFFALDGDKDTLWVGVNGESSYIEFEFDKPYCIDTVLVPSEIYYSFRYDKYISSSSEKFEHVDSIHTVKVTINDQEIFYDKGEADGKKIIGVDPTKVLDVKTIKLEFPSFEGKYVAISDVEFYSCK